MKRFCLALLLLLLLPACGRAVAAPATDAPTTMEIKTTTWSERITTVMEDDTLLVFQKAIVYNDIEQSMQPQEIWLRDKNTGEETLLLGENIGALPHFSKQINERYFAYYYAIPESCDIRSDQIYDLQKRRTVAIEYPGWVFISRIADGKLYYKTVQEDEGDIVKTYTIDIAALDGGGPIIPKEVR